MTREEDEDTTTTTTLSTTTISENITIITPTDAPTTIITTTEIQNSTTITNIEPNESDDTILIASLTAVGAVLLILCIALSGNMGCRIFNNRFLRKRGMASTLKMEYQVFLCILQKNSAIATLGLKEMEKFLWELN